MTDQKHLRKALSPTASVTESLKQLRMQFSNPIEQRSNSLIRTNLASGNQSLKRGPIVIESRPTLPEISNITAQKQSYEFNQRSSFRDNYPASPEPISKTLYGS